MYKFISADLSAKFRETHNMHTTPVYHLSLDGKIILPDEYFSCSGGYDLKNDKKRYVQLCVYREGTYSDDIVKSCKLKHKKNFQFYDCVFDKETEKIIYEIPDRDSLKHINLYNNIAEFNGVFTYLPTNEILHSAEYGLFDLWKTSNFIFIREGYRSPVIMMATDTGEIETYD